MALSDIDVSAEIQIQGDPTDVAAIMFDPSREPDWVSAVTGVELLDPALVPGAKVRHTGRIMGQDLSWTTQVEAVHFPHVLALRIDDGPFVGMVRYDIQRAGSGTRARIRNVGQLSVGGFLPAAMVSGPLKAAMAADLERLKGLVEG